MRAARSEPGVDVVSAGNTVTIEGLNEFRAAVRAAQQRAPRELTAALKAAGRPVVDRVQSVVPRRSGLLASSFSVSVRATKGQIVSRAPYAGGAEWGSRGKWSGWVRAHGASPRFVWPAVESQQDEIIRVLDEGLRDVITIMGWAKP